MKKFLRNRHGRHLATAIIGALMCMYSANADAQVSYAKLDTEARTLTFMYDDTRTTLGEGEYALNSGDARPSWEPKSGNFNKVIFDESFSKARPTSCHRWFSVCYNLTTIEGIENLHTDEVTDMAYMFYSCSKLTALDVSHFNTSKVTTMERMFYACTALTELDVSNFDTSNVTDFTSMFQRCRGLSEINTSNFNTSNATTLTHLFMECDKLQKLDLRNFNIKNVTSLSYMFNGCKKLTDLDISGWASTDKLTDISYMFYNCSSLETIDISLYIPNVKTVAYMFYGCSKLTGLNFLCDTYGVGTFIGMFQKCSALQDIDLSCISTRNATNMDKMFSDCKGLSTLDLTGFNTANVSSAKQMFGGCSALQTIYVSSLFDLSACRDSKDMFKGCTALVGGVPFKSTKTDKSMAVPGSGYLKSYYTVGDMRYEFTGDVPFVIDQLDLTEADGFMSYMPATVASATYTRPNEGYKYGTICLPFALAKGEGYTLYRLGGIDYANLVIRLTPTERLEAGESGFYALDNPMTRTITFAAANSEVREGWPENEIRRDKFVDYGMLYGTYYSSQYVNPGFLILKNDNMVFSKYYGEDTYDNIGAFMCAIYLNWAEMGDMADHFSGNEIFTIEIDNTPTAIGGIETDGNKPAPTAIYDISGRKLQQLQKGMNIIKEADGRTRKIMMK